MKKSNFCRCLLTFAIFLLAATGSVLFGQEPQQKPFAGDWRSEEFSLVITDDLQIDSYSLKTNVEWNTEATRSSAIVDRVECDDPKDITDVKISDGKLKFKIRCGEIEFKAEALVSGDLLKIELSYTVQIGGNKIKRWRDATKNFELKRQSEQTPDPADSAENSAKNNCFEKERL